MIMNDSELFLDCDAYARNDGLFVVVTSYSSFVFARNVVTCQSTPTNSISHNFTMVLNPLDCDACALNDGFVCSHHEPFFIGLCEERSDVAIQSY